MEVVKIANLYMWKVTDSD